MFSTFDDSETSQLRMLLAKVWHLEYIGSHADLRLDPDRVYGILIMLNTIAMTLQAIMFPMQNSYACRDWDESMCPILNSLVDSGG